MLSPHLSVATRSRPDPDALPPPVALCAVPSAKSPGPRVELSADLQGVGRTLKKPWRHRWESVQTGLKRLVAPLQVRLAGWGMAHRRAAPGGPSSPRVSVTLTSHPPRFGSLHLTLLSLLNQWPAPDEVVLCLHAPDVARLPRAVLRLRQRGLRIRALETDLRVYLKLIPSLAESPQVTWVTADDDVYYPAGWLAALLAAHQTDPQAVICRRAHLMRFDEKGQLRPYAAWAKQTGLAGPDEPLFLTGVGGVLYPPGSLHPHATRADLFMALCPDADDIWLNWMARLQGTRIRRIGDTCEPVIWLGSQRVALFRRNRRGSGNDDSLARMVQAYGHACLHSSFRAARAAQAGAQPAQEAEAA